MKREIKSCHMYRCRSKLVLLFDVTTAAATRYLRPDYRLIHNTCLLYPGLAIMVTNTGILVVLINFAVYQSGMGILAA
jgi:hypothetical protein